MIFFINKVVLKEKTHVNYDIRGTSSFQHANPLNGTIENIGSNVKNVPDDAFH